MNARAHAEARGGWRSFARAQRACVCGIAIGADEAVPTVHVGCFRRVSESQNRRVVTREDEKSRARGRRNRFFFAIHTTSRRNSTSHGAHQEINPIVHLDVL